jgi:hypothetical protein
MTAKITTGMDGISPSSASVPLGATQQFTSSVGTVWVAAYGTVSSGGLYTAPDAMPPSHTDTVLVAGEGGAASADIHLLPASPPIAAASRGREAAFGNLLGDSPGDRGREHIADIAERSLTAQIELCDLLLEESRLRSPTVSARDREF